MADPSVIHSTFVIERSYPKPPERVFSAFASAPLKRGWFLEGRKNEVEKHELDFRVGGAEYAQVRFKEGTPLSGCRHDHEHKLSGHSAQPAHRHFFHNDYRGEPRFGRIGDV